MQVKVTRYEAVVGWSKVGNGKKVSVNVDGKDQEGLNAT